VTQDWVEGTAATGSDPVDGATWDTYDSVNLWAAPGGDFDPTVEATTSLRDPIVEPAEGWYSWDVTGLVTAWVAGTSNYGLLVSAAGANNGPKIR
jgi:hypothetical protein